MDSYLDWLAIVLILGVVFFALGWFARGGWDDATRDVEDAFDSLTDGLGRTSPDTSPLMTPAERGEDIKPPRLKAIK